jgi:hypothetical protein
VAQLTDAGQEEKYGNYRLAYYKAIAFIEAAKGIAVEEQVQAKKRG